MKGYVTFLLKLPPFNNIDISQAVVGM